MNTIGIVTVSVLIGAVAYRLLLDWNTRVRKRRAHAAALPHCSECGRVESDEPAHLGNWNNDGGFVP